MTLPDERFQALKKAKKLLEELCDPGRTPRVPGSVRAKANAALRHYPYEYELEKLADASPDILDKVSFNDKLSQIVINK
jgi:hypothetical protein